MSNEQQSYMSPEVAEISLKLHELGVFTFTADELAEYERIVSGELKIPLMSPQQSAKWNHDILQLDEQIKKFRASFPGTPDPPCATFINALANELRKLGIVPDALPGPAQAAPARSVTPVAAQPAAEGPPAGPSTSAGTVDVLFNYQPNQTPPFPNWQLYSYGPDGPITPYPASFPPYPQIVHQ